MTSTYAKTFSFSFLQVHTNYDLWFHGLLFELDKYFGVKCNGLQSFMWWRSERVILALMNFSVGETTEMSNNAKSKVTKIPGLLTNANSSWKWITYFLRKM